MALTQGPCGGQDPIRRGVIGFRHVLIGNTKEFLIPLNMEKESGRFANTDVVVRFARLADAAATMAIPFLFLFYPTVSSLFYQQTDIIYFSPLYIFF